MKRGALRSTSSKSRGLAAPAQVCVLVLGMHRSGTSALTRALNLHGVQLGADLLAPAADNSKGFWEQRAVVEVHERLLAGLGSAWGDPRPLPDGWMDSDAAASASVRIKEILLEFSAAPVFAIKDPRLCEFAPLWISILQSIGIRPVILLAIRHPLEVAESIAARDGWSRELSWLLWSRSVLDAIAASAGLQRQVVSYESLLGDWNSTLAAVAASLQINWPLQAKDAAPEILQFLDANDRHHVSSVASDVVVPQYLLDLYDAVLSVEKGSSWDQLEKFMPLGEAFRMSKVSLHEQYSKPNIPGAPTHKWERGGLVQIFYRKADQIYSEDRSMTMVWPDSTTVSSFTFDFPDSVDVDALRIDFDDFPGVFLLDALVIDGQAVVVPGRIMSSNGTVLGNQAASTAGLVAPDNDPWIEVAVAGMQCSKIELSITRLSLNDAVHGLRASVDMERRLDALFRRVVSTGDCLLANYQSAQAMVATVAEQQAAQVAHLESEVARLECSAMAAGLQQLEAVARLESQSNEASRGMVRYGVGIREIQLQLADLTAVLATQVSEIAALAEAAARNGLAIQAVATQSLAQFSNLEASLGRLEQACGSAIDEQAQAISRLDQRINVAADGLLQHGVALVKVSDGVTALAALVAAKALVVESASDELRSQGEQLDEIFRVLNQIDKSRLSSRIRRFFGYSR